MAHPESHSPVRTDDDAEAEKLLDEGVVAPRAQRQRQGRSVVGSALWWISYTMMVFTVGFLALTLAMERRQRASGEVAGDVNGIMPKFSKHLVTLQPENRFVQNVTSPTFKQDTKEAWLGLVPKGLGFVSIPDPSSHPHLAAPYMKYNKPVYTTSVTHQLHCLYMIMQGVNELATNNGKLHMDMDADEGLTREGEDPAEHLSHCFDYLRQVIMCHADTALEGLQTTFGPDVGGSDGWNTVHVCRNYDEVYRWLEEKRIDDREWI